MANIKPLLGDFMGLGLHPVHDITDYFSQARVNKMPIFLDTFKLLLLNVHFALAEGHGQLKKKKMEEPVLVIVHFTLHTQ
jgi:hypothetical protein